MKRLMLAALFVSSSVVFAQQQSSDAIPKDLVKLLLSGTMMMPDDNFDIIIGLPADFPRELIPEGAKAVISTTSRRGTTVIAEAPEMPGAMARYERQLANAGWVRPNVAPMQPRGLMASPAAQTPSMWCHGDRLASLSLGPRPEGGSMARVSINTNIGRGSPCHPMTERAYSPMGYFGDVDMPMLLPPPGSRARGGSSGSGGGDSYDQRMRLETALPVPDLLQHYRAQIEKHGWKYESQAIAEGLGMMRFSLMSAKKEPVVATVTVTRVPGDPPIEIGLRLVKASDRPY